MDGRTRLESANSISPEITSTTLGEECANNASKTADKKTTQLNKEFIRRGWAWAYFLHLKTHLARFCQDDNYSLSF